MGFTAKRVLRRVLRRGSEKGVSRRCLARPLGEYAPLGVHPSYVEAILHPMYCCHRNHYQINFLGIFPGNVPVKNYQINCWGIFIGSSVQDFVHRISD